MVYRWSRVMSLTKHTDLDWAFPVMAFRATGEIEYFDDIVPFTEYPQSVFRDGILMGMELIDSEGERWFVRAVDRTSPEPAPRRWWHVWPFWEEPRAVIELALENGGQLDFEAVRQKVCDRVAAEARQYGEPESEVEETLVRLRQAKDYKDISDILGLADAVGFLD